MAQTADNVFRDFVTDGVSASGANKPAKAAIRELLTGYEAAIAGFQAGGGIVFLSKATADATLTYAANTMAWVIGDATAANNGVYQKQGASGSGSWTRVADLPYSFIKASNADAGTANALAATTSIPVPSADGATLITVNVTAANTGPATVSFNGGTPLSIVTSSGNALQAGYLTAGMQIAGFKVGSDFRLMTDIASAAIVAAAEAEADRAEAAAAAAMGSVPNTFAANRTALKAVDPAGTTSVYLKEAGRQGQFFWQSGDQSALVTADTLEGIVVAPTSDTTGASGAWVRVVANDEYDFRWFGALADSTGGATGTDNTSLILPALGGVKAHGGNTLVVPPYCRADTRSITAAGNALNMRVIDKSGLDFVRTTIPYQMSSTEFQYTDISGAGHAYNGNTKFLSGYYHVAQAVESLDPPGQQGSKASYIFWSENAADWQLTYDRTTAGFEEFAVVSYGPLSAGTTKMRIGGQNNPHFGQFVFNYSYVTTASFVYGQSGFSTDSDWLTKGISSYYSLPIGSTGDIFTVYRLGTAAIGRDYVKNDGSREVWTKNNVILKTDADGKQQGQRRNVVYAQSGTVNLTSAQSGTVVSNVGGSGPATVNLPAAEVGLEFFFSIDASQMLTINPSGTNNISGGGAGQDYQSNNAGAALHLVAISSARWMALSDGTWTFV